MVLIDMPYLGSMLNALQGRMQHPHLHRMDRRPLAYYHSCLVENNLHRCIAGKDSDRKQQESEAVSPRPQIVLFPNPYRNVSWRSVVIRRMRTFFVLSRVHLQFAPSRGFMSKKQRKRRKRRRECESDQRESRPYIGEKEITPTRGGSG